jgi:alpha-glucosidase
MEFPAGGVDGEPLDLTDTNSFLLGPDLLVAQSPYPDELDDYPVALPSTGWYDYWTGSPIQGDADKKASDASPVVQPSVEIHPSADTLPVFARAGAIVPRQPLVQSTDETPDGPLTLRVYPPTQRGDDCRGTVYLDDGVSYAFQKGEFLREDISCQLTSHGLTVTLNPRQGGFVPWWKLVSIEVYGQTKSVSEASVSRLKGSGDAASPVLASFDSEHHRITVLIPDDGRGAELNLTY